MPVTLDITVGGDTANSYVSLAEADAYCDTRLYAGVWTNETDVDTRARALISATARIDQASFAGLRHTTTQRLAWPRFDVRDPDTRVLILTTEIPRAIKEATVEYAMVLLAAQADLAITSTVSAYRSLALPGGLKLDFRDDAPRAGDALPPVVIRLLAPYLLPDDAVRIARAG